MSENNEPTLEELEAQLRAEAADADANGVELGDSNTPIDANTGDDADPANGQNVGNEDDTNPSDNGGGDDGDDGGESDEGNGGDDGGQSNSDGEGGTQSADSSNGNGNGGEGKPKSKAEKDDERRNKSWKKLEEEKAKFLREKAEWEAAKINAPANASAGGGAAENPAVNPQALAAEFDKLARDFEAAGDFDKADEARAKADQLRKMLNVASNGVSAGSRSGAAGMSPQQVQQFKVAWNANVERAVNEFPEMKDASSDFGKMVQSLLNAPDTREFFGTRPDGAYVAAQLTKMKMTALRVPVLEKENAALKEEIKKLRQGMTLPASGASGRQGAAKSFDSMTLEEQEQFLRRQAESADASSRPVVY